jgi:hypothetical protein
LLRRRHRDRAVLELVLLLVRRLVVDVADRVAQEEPEEPAAVRADAAELLRLPRVL